MNLNNLTKVTGELQYHWIATVRQDDIKYELTVSGFFFFKRKTIIKDIRTVFIFHIKSQN